MPRPRIKREPKPAEPSSTLHRRNKHQGRYNLELLAMKHAPLEPFIGENEHGTKTINFSDPDAVKALNTGLLKHQYNIEHWDIPSGCLVPPIPGRADYVHYAADLMSGNYPKPTTDPIPKGGQIRCLDIGVGANCIYPIIAHKEYGWHFVGTDIDGEAVSAAHKIVSNNQLADCIEIRQQLETKHMFQGIVKSGEYFDLAMCNPPFHASEEEAIAATRRKVKNLTGTIEEEPLSNFGGKPAELWCDGGELQFVQDFIKESKTYGEVILWFTILISKKTNVGRALRQLEQMDALNVQVIEMTQGQKQSRIIGWTFHNRKARKNWHRSRWDYGGETNPEKPTSNKSTLHKKRPQS